MKGNITSTTEEIPQGKYECRTKKAEENCAKGSKKKVTLDDDDDLFF